MAGYKSTFAYKLIYIMRISDKEHKGCLLYTSQRWANMSDAEFAAAQCSGDSIRIDVEDVIRQLEEKYALDPQPVSYTHLLPCLRTDT